MKTIDHPNIGTYFIYIMRNYNVRSSIVNSETIRSHRIGKTRLPRHGVRQQGSVILSPTIVMTTLIPPVIYAGEVFDFLVQNGRMKEKDARQRFREIVSAIQYCHQKQIVHRDLKVSSIHEKKNLGKINLP